ncbi:MAG: hypothetical protein C0523_00245 [Cytophaga sp.]|nr:hypothetical protein [Cytophaga sp.]
MKKAIVFIGIIVVLVASAFIYFRFFYTKSFSPEATVEFKQDDVTISVFYNRPYKKGREIFGGLEPFGKVWRTGANEATVFETNKDLTIQGKILKKGKYTLWTIPGEQTWKILFNTETGQWGIDFNGAANRDPKNDVLVAEVPSLIQDKIIEQFTISVEKMEDEIQLILLWDKTVVTLPMAVTSR